MPRAYEGGAGFGGGGGAGVIALTFVSRAKVPFQSESPVPGLRCASPGMTALFQMNLGVLDLFTFAL